MIDAPEAGRVVVIVNEAGEVALDGRLVVGTVEKIVELREGCICCTVRGDLADAVGKLLARRKECFRPLKFDRLLVECGGLASPGPVVQTFLLDPTLAAATRVDGVVALASAPDLVRQLDDHGEAAEQLAYADRVVLNHCDRTDDIASAEAAVRRLNPAAPLDRAVRADVPIAPLFDLRSDDPARWRIADAPPATHTTGVSHVVLRATTPLDLGRLKLFLQFIAARRTHNVMRLKGIFHCEGLARGVVAHGIYQWLELGPGPMAPPTESQLLVIGRGLDREELARGWEAVTRG